MRKPVILLLLLLPLLIACDPCSNLREQDEKISAQFQQLQSKNMDESNIRYLNKLRALHEKEQELFQQVRNCNIEDSIEYNYWYGQRLKFPSELEQTYKRLSRRP